MAAAPKNMDLIFLLMKDIFWTIEFLATVNECFYLGNELLLTTLDWLGFLQSLYYLCNSAPSDAFKIDSIVMLKSTADLLAGNNDGLPAVWYNVSPIALIFL
jgi:hypothetical protein